MNIISETYCENAAKCTQLADKFARLQFAKDINYIKRKHSAKTLHIQNYSCNSVLILYYHEKYF